MTTAQRPSVIWDRELDGPPPRGKGHRLLSLAQRPWFAFAAGVVAPIVCLVFDPIVFQGGDEHGPILGRVWLCAYSFLALEMVTLSVWLLARERLGVACGPVAGILLAGAIVSAGLGMLLLPLSVIGLVVLIGVLGLTPWLTAYVYYRQGLRALEAAESRAGWAGAAFAAIVGFALAFGLPISVQVGARLAWRAAVRAVADGDAAAWRRVWFWYRWVDTGDEDSPLDQAIRAEPDPIRKRRLMEPR